MDANTRDVLVTALQVGLGVLGGLAASLVTFRLTRQQEHERWAREDAIRADAQLRDARSRWAEERRELYAQMLRLEGKLVVQARKLYRGDHLPETDWSSIWDEIYHVTLQIKLVSPDVGALASDLWDVVTDMHLAARKHKAGTSLPDVATQEKPIIDARKAFIRAAQRDLTP